MICYECSLTGNRRDAAGLCHFCSAGLCTEHANVVQERITTHAPLMRTVALPRKARRLLCQTCREALGQLPEDEVHEVGSFEERHEPVLH